VAARFEKGAEARGRFGDGIGRGDANDVEALAAGVGEESLLLGRKSGFVQKSRSA
jgi:hypothetical protein